MFQNSGAEATEAAIKAARRYFYSIGKFHKNRILCIKNYLWKNHCSYLCQWIKNDEGFGPKVPGFDHIEFKNFRPRFNPEKNKKNTAQ